MRIVESYEYAIHTINESVTATNISIMDTFSSLYEYCLITKCRIPKIIIRGVTEYWMKLINYLKYISCDDLE